MKNIKAYEVCICQGTSLYNMSHLFATLASTYYMKIINQIGGIVEENPHSSLVGKNFMKILLV